MGATLSCSVLLYAEASANGSDASTCRLAVRWGFDQWERCYHVVSCCMMGLPPMGAMLSCRVLLYDEASTNESDAIM